jgi:hypothetical protein
MYVHVLYCDLITRSSIGPYQLVCKSLYFIVNVVNTRGRLSIIVKTGIFILILKNLMVI